MLICLIPRGANVWQSSRARAMLKNAHLVANIGVDTAESELSKVCRSKQAIPTPVINLALLYLSLLYSMLHCAALPSGTREECPLFAQNPRCQTNRSKPRRCGEGKYMLATEGRPLREHQRRAAAFLRARFRARLSDPSAWRPCAFCERRENLT